MNPSDIIIICALDLPIEQSFDLMHWYLLAHPDEAAEVSIWWWIQKNACAIQAMGAKRYWKTH